MSPELFSFRAYALYIASLSLLWIVIRLATRRPKSISNAIPPQKSREETHAPQNVIEPLHDFEWKSTKPVQHRPFKEKYHLTMALEQCTISNLVNVDSTYLERLRIRRRLHETNADEVLRCNPVADAAVTELYNWMMTTYLPQRFPTMFRLDSTGLFHNCVTGEGVKLMPSTSGDSIKRLRQMSSHIDNDFLILLPEPDPTASPPTYPGPAFQPSSLPPSASTPTTFDPSKVDVSRQPSYHLHAFAATFPSGFSWASKLSLPLSQIHAPVPHYRHRLGRSMDRFFASLPPGRVVARRNWAVTVGSELFNLASNHGDAGDGPAEQESIGGNGGADGGHVKGGRKKVLGSMDEQFRHASSIPSKLDSENEDAGNEVDVQNVRLRVERQTLHRLPETGALVFGIKTYQYTLDEVKRNGEADGEALAKAIEGLWLGSAERMVLYKRADVWGRKVVDYLRSS